MHFNRNLLLTTSEVAELLHVHPSTVKRWCDADELATDRTDGGHRRLRLDDVMTFARGRDISTFLTPFHPFEGHVWLALRDGLAGRFGRFHELAMGWLTRGEVRRVSLLFEELARHPQVPFDLFCDEAVRGFMVEVGDAWREGRLRVGEEHLASQALTEALLRTHAGRFEPHEDAPVALIGSMEGQQHHLGALCARLLLEREGWRVYYLGPDVPVEDFAALQRSVGATLVGVSFSRPLTEADVRRCVRVLQALYSPGDPYGLALGGDVEQMPELDEDGLPFQWARAFPSIGAFRQAVTEEAPLAGVAGG